jgi:NADPH:quinone reductase-like Zn-dependent oxidoreductase
VIDHSRAVDAELRRIGVTDVHFILSLAGTEHHWGALIAALAPQGHICVADNPSSLDLAKLRGKAGALHFEMMWVRVIFDTPEIAQIGRLLSETAAMVDAGLIVAPVSEQLGEMSAATLREAHRRIEGGSTVGKLVLSGFAD